MLKKLILLFAIVFVTSCKSTKVVAEGEINAKLTSKTVVKLHYENENSFKTLAGKVRIHYADGESSQNVSVSLRMEKDKAIWLSAPLGIVKAYITPERVSFYNKLENEYFDGDFSYLSDLLGTQVDFSILQNLFMGQAILDLRTEKYNLDVVDGAYRLTPKITGKLYKALFKVEPKNYKMALQQLSQPLEKRVLKIVYEDYQNIDNEIVPNIIKIEALAKDSKNNIELEFRHVVLNEAVNFPYTIPKGFKKIEL